MRPGTLFAAACFGGLGYWYVAQSEALTALLMFALAAALVAVGVLPPGRRLGAKGGAPAPKAVAAPGPPVDPQEHLRAVRSWRIIAIVGLAVSVGAAFVYPPLSLVLAALALYALHRMRLERLRGPA